LNLKPEIRITFRTVSGNEIKIQNGFNPKQNYAELTVSDNGIGFDNQYSGKIFHVFQRLHGKSEYSGTGIGLSIVERIVKNHNGFIEAKGEKGDGAVFVGSGALYNLSRLYNSEHVLVRGR
jgi:light-regulated signal transduction histidine kinase (bacteriophytochrome)